MYAKLVASLFILALENYNMQIPTMIVSHEAYFKEVALEMQLMLNLKRWARNKQHILILASYSIPRAYLEKYALRAKECLSLMFLCDNSTTQ
jgi:hypothetical protein